MDPHVEVAFVCVGLIMETLTSVNQPLGLQTRLTFYLPRLSPDSSLSSFGFEPNLDLICLELNGLELEAIVQALPQPAEW